VHFFNKKLKETIQAARTPNPLPPTPYLALLCDLFPLHKVFLKQPELEAGKKSRKVL